MARYEIAFSAQLVSGAQLALVKANVAKLFQADEQRVALLFSGRRIVIKSNLDAAGAEKYRSALERAGAVAEVTCIDEEIEEIELTAAPVSTPISAPVVSPVKAAASSPPAGRLQVAPRDEYMAAFAEVDAPDFGIAPLGDDVQDDKPQAAVPMLDLSQLSLAPPGSDMGEAKKAPAGPPPDISHLKLQD
ncbi:hypothetical protein SAMN05216206_2720 [Pseudomonas guineae]|uniref:Uncharacterized protein n=1 Tax=Pseudomonas guineae TaxID=425504 RepID=A0A1I3K5V8_9PSED|nr:hypothetical protein [Pseudomonas guineae]SFI67595.1 hypothetical protein SAMN05216206_2720 [Pseudomonas guineae]